MYTCHTHGWKSEEVPCPSCQETITLVEPVDTADPGNQSYPSVDSTGEQYAAQAKEGPEERAEKYIAENNEWMFDQNHFHITRSFVNTILRQAYITGAQSSLQPSSPDPTVLVQALRDIIEMKLEPGEKDYKYAFNRCWHIATEALNNKKEEGI